MVSLMRVFSRDFCLANVELWCHAESFSKAWAKRAKPFQPYLVFERHEGFVDVYYSEKGFAWTKQKLMALAHESGFLDEVERQVRVRAAPLMPACRSLAVLDHAALVVFIDAFEVGYPWFEAMWFLCEIIDTLGDVDTSPLLRLRKDFEILAPNAELVLRGSIRACFPQVASFAHVLRCQEIRSAELPDDKELKRRAQGYFFSADRLFIGIDQPALESMLGVTFPHIDVSASELHGSVAFKGRVQGTARLIMGVNDLHKMRKGDVVIASMTMPDVLPAVRLASAIVTDEGGMLCHAAIVSRELKIPCVIGTKHASKIFKDGDLVEVDAEKGVVRKL